MASRDEIIAEIKRTARENGGKPLGLARFEQETAIKPYDWGKYWPRFGDAQKEAGFQANQMQGAHPNEFLIGKLVALARKLGKFPTSREIESERHLDPDLPTKKTFQRLDTKGQLAQLVSTYCETHDGFEDVARLCSGVFRKDDQGMRVSGVADTSVGDVYLFKSGKYYKIGRSSDLVRRGTEIRIQLPEKMTLVHSIKTDDPPGVEAYWHQRFASKRMNGEWFDLDPGDIKAFKRWRRIS